MANHFRGSTSELPFKLKTPDKFQKEGRESLTANRSSINLEFNLLSGRQFSTTSEAAGPHPALGDLYDESTWSPIAACILRGFDYFGTAAFAMTGCITAASCGADVLGSIMIGVITAVGGGTVRDAMILNESPFWVLETFYIWLSFLIAFLTFFLWPLVADRADLAPGNVVVQVVDAVGVGAFCVVGTQCATRAQKSALVATICGTVTATFGGVLRDVLCRRPVRIVHSYSELYATAALCGSMAYLLSRSTKIPVSLTVAVGFAMVIAIRLFAYSFDIRLPAWDAELLTQTAKDERQLYDCMYGRTDC